MSVRAMKAGAVDFLTKPYRDQDVLDAIHVGLDRDRVRRSHDSEIDEDGKSKKDDRSTGLTSQQRLGRLLEQRASASGITD
jgi:FixJ family two-component response regulator